MRALDKFEELAAFGFAERNVSTNIRDVYYGGMIAWLTGDKPVRLVKPEARARFEEAVMQDRSALGAQALGWGGALRGEWPAARRWFENAIGWSGFDPLGSPEKPDDARVKIIEGYVQALRGDGDPGRAEDVAYGWRDASSALSGLYLQIFTQAIAEDSASLSPQRLTRFAAFAESQRSADAAGALGWRLYRVKQPADAIVWFERALAWSPEGAAPAKLAEGYALSLRAAGRLEDTETFAWGFVKDSPDMRAVYISAVVAELADDGAHLSRPRLERFIDVVGAAHSAVGAQALGWRRMKGDNCVYAAPWFRKAAAWSADNSDDGDTARGLALALRKVGAFREAEDLAYAWRDRSPDMSTLFVDTAIEGLTSEAPALSMSEMRVRRLSGLVLATRHVRGAQALGWWRYRQAACGYGGDWFRLATAWSDDDKRDAKTDEGYGLTLRATGRLADAEALAFHWANENPLMRKLYIDVMVEELSRDNPPEPIDEARLKDFTATIEPIRSALGAQALGWYRLERGELDEAARWFKSSLDWWPAQRYDRSKRLSAPVDSYKAILAKLALDPKDYRRTPRAYPNSSALIGKSTENYVDTEEGFAKTQEGYAQTLRALGRVEEAETIAWAWRERWPGLRSLFDDIAAAELDRREGPGDFCRAFAAVRRRHRRRSLSVRRRGDGVAAVSSRSLREFERLVSEGACLDQGRRAARRARGGLRAGVAGRQEVRRGGGRGGEVARRLARTQPRLSAKRTATPARRRQGRPDLAGAVRRD